MSDMLPMAQGAPQAPRQSQEEMAADAVESNRSILNPQDGMTMAGRMNITEETTLGEFFTQLGLDLSAPAIGQLDRFFNAQLTNIDPLDKMKNIAEGNNVVPGAGRRAADQVAAAEGMGAPAPGMASPGLSGPGTPEQGIEGLLAAVR